MAQAGTVSDKQLFYNILDNLGHEEFEKFKWFLLLEGSIKESALGNANRMKTVDKITQTFVSRSAEVIKKVLHQIQRNDLVEELTNSTGRPGRTLTDSDEGTRVSSLKESLRTWSRRLNSEANLENENIRFFAVGITNKNQRGSSIYLYEDGFPVSETFEPPSQPKAVTVGDVSHNSVTLKIDPPQFGSENITSYSVESCVRGEEQWKQQETSKPEEVTVGDLSPDTEYMFRCRAVTSVGVGPANQVSRPVKTLPCSPPGKLQVESNPSEFSVSWEKPAEIGGNVRDLSYIVEYAKTDDKADTEEDLQWSQKKTKTERAAISGLEQLTEYAVRVRCDFGSAGRSKESITVKVCTTKHTPLKESLKTRSRRLNSDSPSVYKLPLEKEDMNIDGYRRFNFGKESLKLNRTIMLLGATGAGKSALINGMINYIVGVNWEDDFRFKLIEEEGTRSQCYRQTTEVTVYKINHQEEFRVPFSLTIIDTPGFADGNIKTDREITECLRNFFFSAEGVDEIDAVCVVAQASLGRLTPTQKFVFDSVLSLFGKDIAENFRILVTFADGERPPVLKAIKAADVPCSKTKDGLPVHFKFNNSAIFAENKTSASGSKSGRKARNFDEMFWDMGAESMEMFFEALELMKTKSLTLTQEVLRQRLELEYLVEHLQRQVRVTSAKLEDIKETSEQLKDIEAELIRSKRSNIPGLKWTYDRAQEKKSALEALLVMLRAEHEAAQGEETKLMSRSAKCLERLKEIALKPDAFSTLEYIDMLIEDQKVYDSSGLEDRVQYLMDMRDKAVIMAEIASRGTYFSLDRGLL